MELCRFHEATVTYGGVTALAGLTLTIDSDSGTTGIIGPNGAGKSTALKALTGAVRLSHGETVVLGHGVGERATPTTVARWGVVRTYQAPRPFARMTVQDNVRAAGEAQRGLWGSSRKSGSRDRVHAILERLNLASVADRAAGGLSLAERKRLELAKALATEPTLILLDEMFEGLSESEVFGMVDTIKQLSAEHIHFIFIEHIMRALHSLADNVVVLQKGLLIAQGPTRQVLQDETVRRAYLGFSNAI